MSHVLWLCIRRAAHPADTNSGMFSLCACAHDSFMCSSRRAKPIPIPEPEPPKEEAVAIWPSARLCCFGSRATGLASATSDVDLVLCGVLDAPPDTRRTVGVFDAQVTSHFNRLSHDKITPTHCPPSTLTSILILTITLVPSHLHLNSSTRSSSSCHV